MYNTFVLILELLFDNKQNLFTGYANQQLVTGCTTIHRRANKFTVTMVIGTKNVQLWSRWLGRRPFW